MAAQQAGKEGLSRAKGLLGSAVLAIWCDIDPENEAEFNDWYTHQHLPERVGVAGFLRGRRWAAEAGAGSATAPRYFTLYEVERLQTLSSAPYLQRLDSPTDWTRRTLPWFRNQSRTACRISASLGQGIGGYAATVEFAPADGAAERLKAWIISSAMAKALEHPEMVGVHLCEADETVTRAKEKTAEGKVPGGGAGGALVRSFLLAEATGQAGLEAFCKELCGPLGLAAHGAESDLRATFYRLLVSLSR